ncbi:hypothetical protein HPB52_022482 [Rhipicephalus sanguineus]|uniref:Uncharacterized protein n=1 Tax=Rhipicephalus sanguineus TaxID=34632 RepID=A0A9D4T4J5_RHISA|nr:hypothetical protein HPB52_022482 [Rhipicephalus sanguineus]
MVAVIHQIGLQVLNTRSFTFVRRTGDISLTSEGVRCDWATQPDSWRSGHLPIIITPVEDPKDQAVKQSRLASVPAAALRRSNEPGLPESGSSSISGSDHPVQDTREPSWDRPPPPELNGLPDAGLRVGSPEYRTLFNGVVAVCRQHANCRQRQSS